MDPIIDYSIHGKKPIVTVPRWENSFVLTPWGARTGKTESTRVNLKIGNYLEPWKKGISASRIMGMKYGSVKFVSNPLNNLLLCTEYL